MSARAAVLFVLERGEAERSLPGPALADPNERTASSALPPTDSSSDQSP